VSDSNRKYGKPNNLAIPCPYCHQDNLFPIMMLGDIIGKKKTCKLCYLSFYIFIHWEPKIRTQKEGGL